MIKTTMYRQYLRDRGYEATTTNKYVIRINNKVDFYPAKETFCIDGRVIGKGYVNLINYLKTL